MGGETGAENPIPDGQTERWAEGPTSEGLAAVLAQMGSDGASAERASNEDQGRLDGIANDNAIAAARSPRFPSFAAEAARTRSPRSQRHSPGDDRRSLSTSRAASAGRRGARCPA